MSRKRLDVSWKREVQTEDFKPALKRYTRYLEESGLRESTISSYVVRVGKFLEFARTDEPDADDFAAFQETLHEKRLSRSSINNYCFAIQRYYEMRGKAVSFKFIRPANTIPYFFDENDIARIFSACTNLKHLAMLQTLFYGCLRASELCNLDDCDLDLQALTLRVEGKGGKEAIVYITDDCAKTLRRYLEVRPPLVIDGRKPLFYTDFGKRWERRGVYRMFMYYKRRAGIEKKGGVHVFSRHSVGSLLVKRGCDIVTVKELMRHSDVHTTMRYMHIS
ncbi:MAG: tyrosine-type recombinase/integrase, partial [Methanothrix sp.]